MMSAKKHWLGLLLGLVAVVFVTLNAAAAGSGGVRFTLGCGTLRTGSGTFIVTANGIGSAVTVPCGGSAIVTNLAWTAGSSATISLVMQPVGTMLAVPYTTRVTLTAGLVDVSMSAVPIPTAGVKVTLSCQPGAAGTATIRLTANDASSTVTVSCGQSVTVSNPLWTAWTIATVDPVSAPKGTYFYLGFARVGLGTTPVSYTPMLLPCPTGRSTVAGCPVPARSGLDQVVFGSRLNTILLLVIVPFIVVWMFFVPFEFWIIRGWIRYFSRTQNPRDVVADLSARPALGWWVRRYAGWVRMKHRLFRVPLPPGFDDTTGSDQAA